MSLRPVIPDVDMECGAIRQDAAFECLGDDLARRRFPRKLQELARATDEDIGTGFDLATRHICLQVKAKLARRAEKYGRPHAPRRARLARDYPGCSRAGKILISLRLSCKDGMRAPSSQVALTHVR